MEKDETIYTISGIISSSYYLTSSNKRTEYDVTELTLILKPITGDGVDSPTIDKSKEDISLVLSVPDVAAGRLISALGEHKRGLSLRRNTDDLPKQKYLHVP